MDVSIVMINYNTFKLTCAALDSIFENTIDLKYEILLLDNNSPDGSGAEIASKYKDRIRYIQCGDNLGTSKAFNIGVKEALGKYVLWLNTDILIKENFVKKLFDFMEETPDCGICGGNIYDFNGNPTHSYKKKIVTPKTAMKDRGLFITLWRKCFKKILSEQFNYSGKAMKVGYITGADMMIRKELFDIVGFFDEDIFMYAEETEFTYRVVMQTGYSVYNVPYAHIFHLEGASFNDEKKQFNLNRYKRVLNGNLIYFYKHFGLKSVVIYLKHSARAYKKYIFICTFIKKCAKREYKDKLEVVDNYLAYIRENIS